MNTNRMELNVDTLLALEPISSLSSEQINELTEQAQLEKIAAGLHLFDEGDSDQTAVYVLNGSVELHSSQSSEILTVQGGTQNARHPLANDIPRRTTAITTSECEIVRIDRELLDTLLTWGNISAPETEVVMSEDGIMTIDKASWLKTMIKSPTFRKLPPANIEELLNRLEPIKVKAGDVIIKQGDTGDYFYMINDGIALVTRHPDNDEDSIELAELSEGMTFGEAALISDKPRNATVSMMSDGVLLRLSKEDFIKLLKQPTLNWINFDEAKGMIANGAQWIDVRLESEFEQKHLPDAVNVSMQQLHRRARELDHTKQYICYCQTGRRSSAASFVLNQHGLKAAVLTDGLQTVPAEEMSA